MAQRQHSLRDAPQPKRPEMVRIKRKEKPAMRPNAQDFFSPWTVPVDPRFAEDSTRPRH
ncbi:hypothetical protein ACFQ14_12500 [Pseudahrensia aquimaris]|uniref:Uncharacterized protein n=1 Tax=Pseudahrensia aquimaris TaxID=744461 RepID=A0ABW3FM63_9HYPH